jgi:hypothetical protein
MIVKIIQSIHILLIIFINLSIFVPNHKMKEISLTLLIFMLFQYMTNYGKCGLTQIEYLVMGNNYKEGFLYRIINPIICVPEDYFNKYFYCIHILYIVILGYQLSL